MTTPDTEIMTEEEAEQTVEVTKAELAEIRHLLSHPRTRLRNDAKFNENRENRNRSRTGKQQIEDAKGKLLDLEEKAES